MKKPSVLEIYTEARITISMEKRYDTGFRDGAQKAILYFKYNLAGAKASHIETELVMRWLEKAEKKFCSRD